MIRVGPISRIPIVEYLWLWQVILIIFCVGQIMCPSKSDLTLPLMKRRRQVFYQYRSRHEYYREKASKIPEVICESYKAVSNCDAGRLIFFFVCFVLPLSLLFLIYFFACMVIWEELMLTVGEELFEGLKKPGEG